ncbi:MAG TPA: anion transporter [Nitrospiria bacterium]|nr:anion transporter [Nitrospiria bacterium]
MTEQPSHLPALIIFCVTYLIIVIQKIPRLHLSRAAGALVGAVAMGIFGVLTPPEIYAAIDLDTITFLLGMMLLVGYLETAGFFAVVERLVLRRAASGSALLALVVGSSGLLASVFMNDTICLMFTPVLLRIAARLRVNPVPFLLAMVTASNIGSVMTLVGNPQNMLIGIRSRIPFLDFLGALWPVALGGLLIDFAVIWWVYRDALRWNVEGVARSEPAYAEAGRMPLILSLLVMAAFLVLLMAGFPPQAVAIAMGALVILLESHRPGRLLQQVDWSLLVLFAGLFIVMQGVERAGAIDRLLRLTGGRLAGGPDPAALTVTSALVSNLVSNVPAVLLLSPVLKAAGATAQGWLTLAMSSTLAGNLTVIGSAANLIVFETARRAGVAIGVTNYLKIGLPVTLLSLAFGWWWLSLP